MRAAVLTRIVTSERLSTVCRSELIYRVAQ